ncbi:ADP-ribose pyrophosphatase YjhB (NUDIX family) [Lentzea atacamensis]|uniref:ADP-ribose pyrophosphatase YjhB (NUDIX family) n=1 Tax=Lentzea atacamensis TaxID=531938 RepID=A0ABX9DYX6_9PSEU|nr:NUDIX hydrolase [Lentzea atacamensis]RAS59435.1 ADP-ribose pyrophosphatase YjhB (NUDIX family) [Lentzea atacamensis]
MNTISVITEHDALVVPDESRWGQGYGDRPYTAADLDTIAVNVAPVCGSGHPPRLLAEHPGFGWISASEALVPAGFDLLGHPNRAGVDPVLLDPAVPTAPEGQPQVPAALREYFRSRGWAMDQHGRPLHPRADQLLADPRIGLPASLGPAYHLGESVVADAVAVAGDQVLLTTRATPHDGLIPALPGGHGTPADEGRTATSWRAGNRKPTVDGIIATARRKLLEETGLAAPPDSRAEIVRAIRPVSSVHTLHAWTAVYTVRFELSARTNLTVRPDSGAHWSPLATLGFMWPDHRRALVAAIG